MSLAQNQRAVKRAARRLRQVDEQLLKISCGSSDLGGVIACVRSDLLADAIMTLEAAAVKSAAELKRNRRLP